MAAIVVDVSAFVAAGRSGGWLIWRAALRLLPAVLAVGLLLLSEQTAAVLPDTRMLLVLVLVDASSPAERA